MTGPQRAGTTICARMIAHDTGYEYVDEEDFGVHDVAQLRHVWCTRSRIVVQCPAIAWCIHEFSDEDTLIVWMRRRLEDILASQERIGWTQREEARELAKYGAGQGPVAQVKWRFWVERQRPLVLHWIEIHFEGLTDHPLWAPKDKRREFGVRQWRLK